MIWFVRDKEIQLICLSWGNISFPQNRILTMRITSSSRENTVRPRGRSGTAVAAASRPMSSKPKGTTRISFTAA